MYTQTKQSELLPLRLPQRLLRSQRPPALRAPHALQLLELLLRVALRLRVVHQLVHERPLPARARQVVPARAAERRVRREDRADLPRRPGFSFRGKGARGGNGERTAKCLGRPLMPLPSPASLR